MYLSQEDLKILKKAVRYNMNYIGRDENGEIFMYEEIPNRWSSCWTEQGNSGSMRIDKRALKFINWEDNDPVNVTNLLFSYILREGEDE